MAHNRSGTPNISRKIERRRNPSAPDPEAAPGEGEDEGGDSDEQEGEAGEHVERVGHPCGGSGIKQLGTIRVRREMQREREGVTTEEVAHVGEDVEGWGMGDPRREEEEEEDKEGDERGAEP